MARKSKVIQPSKDTLLKRMNRISGQVTGIGKMIEEDRYCVDIMNQITAARAALSSVGMQILEDHTQNCVHEAVSKKGQGDEIISELIDVLRKFNR